MRKSSFGRKFVAGIAALSMIASASAASAATITASAGEMLGEGTFNEGIGLPWHICENATGEMEFDISDGVYSILIVNPGGASNGGESRWDCQFRHRSMTITYGHTYRLTYSVYATNAGYLFAKLGDMANDDAEYWHTNGTVLDMDYTPGASMSEVESALKSASASGTVISYGEGWDAWKGDQGRVEAKTWTTRAYEFTINQSDITNTTAPEGKKSVEWTFHFGGDGEYSLDGGLFPAGTILKFDNLVLLDITSDENDYVAEETPEQIDLVLNQVGFYPNLDKKATLEVSEGASTTTFEVHDSSGSVVYTGTSGATKYDATAEEYVQELDFSELTTPGTGYYITADGKTSLTFDIGDDIYDGLLTDAMNYYYLNRSGIDLSESYISDSQAHSTSHTETLSLARKAGHDPDVAAISDEWVYIYTSDPYSDYVSANGTIDVTGGWYDAGDYGKYVVNGGVTMWTLANTYERALATDNGSKWDDASGTVLIPEAGNSIPDILDELMWEADFFETMMRDDGMVYHKIHDYKWTALGVMPYVEDGDDEKVQATKNPSRIVKPVTYAATLNAAAAWAQLSRLLESYDSTKAAHYLELAEKAYAAAKSEFTSKYGDIYTETDGDYTKDSMFAPLEQNIGGGPYGDTRVSDEFYWASTELYITTQKDEYGADMRAYPDAFTVPTALYGGENNGDPTAFTWGTLESLGTLSLAYNQDVLTDTEAKQVEEAVQSAADYFIEQIENSGYGTNYKGQDYSVTVTRISGDTATTETLDLVGAYGWGSNSMVANNTIVLGVAYDLTDDVTYLNGAVSSFDYLLGRNAMENSYVTGWGTNTTNYPHHRYWCPQMRDGWPYAPSGCLSGGPNSEMNDPMIQGAGYKVGELAPQKCYYDQNDAWSVNEITINWNAPLVWVTSFLEDEGPLADSDVTPTDPTDTTDTTDDTADESNIEWGDANVDGTVTIMDVILMNKTILNKATLTAQGLLNGDVNQSGAPDAEDTLNIMKLIVNLLTEDDFPIA